MIAGPTYLISCPDCNTYYTRHTLLSYSLFGGIYWTDGKIDGQTLPHNLPFMTPINPPIIKCKGCKAFFKVSEQKHYAKVKGGLPSGLKSRASEEDSTTEKSVFFLKFRSRFGIGNTHPGWAKATNLSLLEPAAEEYLEMLDCNLKIEAGGNREKIIRISAWRKFNDSFRDEAKESPIKWTPKFKENAHALLQLLSTNDTDDLLLKVELLRELGRFQEALKHLKLIKDEISHDKGNFFKKLIKAENSNLMAY